MAATTAVAAVTAVVVTMPTSVCIDHFQLVERFEKKITKEINTLTLAGVYMSMSVSACVT